jgi:histidyl-tRNA synthetase
MGWALGQERIVELLKVQHGASSAEAPDVYFVVAGEQAERAGLALAETLRDQIPSLRLETNCGAGSFKSQMKRADKSGAKFAVILGDTETERRIVGLKSLRIESPQIEVPWTDLAKVLQQRL